MSSCSGLDKQLQFTERCWLSSDAKLACSSCQTMSTGMSASCAQKDMAKEMTVSGKSGVTDKGIVVIGERASERASELQYGSASCSRTPQPQLLSMVGSHPVFHQGYVKVAQYYSSYTSWRPNLWPGSPQAPSPTRCHQANRHARWSASAYQPLTCI